ncbi:MAG TPA: bifunctional 2-C-methyl-D-erythritol 4-phosphate cytidylyltransferase/2-C-methyl-D-erythritol 2,4-cyclodiphosphate synthase [Rhizomicrobium sp.]|nr:bifunctional 2-C-methyl-D-erythritol 4-phosphate cytidylyltransferase/2-C-methyl-D-erythritol 2,4-cyclodiphosphate synthase [Rhizomicrobium sp.]
MTRKLRIAALIVAAGRGARAGAGVPKQYRPLAGRPVLRQAVEAFARHPAVAATQVVIGAGDHERYVAATAGIDLLPPVAGASTRQHSVLHGLTALSAQSPDLVLIHDAARPLASPALIDRVIAALEGADAAIPMLPVADTLKRETEGTWTTVPRDGLMRAQTPQGFRFAAILEAHRAFAGRGLTDDMALAEIAGLKIAAVTGEDTNMKITTRADFAAAERLLGSGAEFRTGMGFDAHRFAPGDHLWLCGVKIAHDRGLEGHSDADAGLHALTDAILGAIGAGDIGQHFPPSGPEWKDAPSGRFLAHALKLAKEAGATIAHCDVTLICERPRVSPHREAMRARIAEILEIEVGRVSVKATTTEGMGFTGRREGLAAQAVATLRFA